MRKSDPERISSETKQFIITRIGQVRSNANLSAKELSRQIGVHEGYISRLESKKDFLPSLEVLLKIIEVCGITLEEFAYHNPQHYKQDKEILDLLDKANEDKKKAIISLLKQ